MVTIILIHHKDNNLVSFCRESSKQLVDTTFISWLQNDSHYGKKEWQLEEGNEGSEYVEYTSGDLTAKYWQMQNADMSNRHERYTPFDDNSLIFF